MKYASPCGPARPLAASTYDEIMDTLLLLEEVPSSLSPQGAMNTKFNEACGTEDEFKLKKSSGLSESKLQSILLYLDQVEKAEVDRSRDLTKSISEVSGNENLTGTKQTHHSE